MSKEFKDKESSGNKGIGIIMIVLIITTWLSVMALLIKCDVGGFGTEVLRPVFKDVPIIKEILPDATDEEIIKESGYNYTNLKDALDRIAVLEASVGSKEAEIVRLTDQVTELQAEVSRLTVYEEEQENFETKKTEFFNEIVYGENAPDTDIYVEWYNELDPEYAEQVYREIVAANTNDQQIIDLAKAYESMDPKDAAEILETMKYDLDTVALIMNNMSAESQGKILAEMDPEYAASVTKKLLP
ncbi:MAG: hypothetical protein E7257_02325 [Lachnospiraceae bacterium]|nr:hypothetical protein [Lachnospiraceae bacterium]